MPRAAKMPLVVCSLLMLFSSSALAVVTPEQKCVIARDRAAGTKLSAVLTCYAKARRKAVAVDSACLAKAQAKFDVAAAKGGSSCGGTVADVDAALQASIARLLAAVSGDGLCPYKSMRSVGKHGSAVIRCKERLVKGSLDNNSGVSVEGTCESIHRAKLFNEVGDAGACGDRVRVESEVFSLADTLLMRGMSVVAPGACGTFVTSWYVPYLNDLAVDVSGDVLVSTWADVQRFHGDGTFVSAFGEPGIGDDHFKSQFRDIAVDGSGNIYVLDGLRLKKFASDGTFLTAWGSEGAGDGQFATYPRGIAAAGSAVYVADTTNRRVQKFADDGTFLTKWDTLRPGDDPLEVPYRIAADSAGGVWVAEGLDPIYYHPTVFRIRHYDGDGAFLSEWTEGSVIDIASGANGDLFLTDGGPPVGSADPPSVGRVQSLLGDGTFLAKWDAAGSPIDPLSIPGDLSADPAGNVYVMMLQRDLIRKFTCP